MDQAPTDRAPTDRFSVEQVSAQFAHEPVLLGAYAVGALDAADATALEDHLTACATCRDELAELRGLKRMLDVVLMPDHVVGARAVLGTVDARSVQEPGVPESAHQGAASAGGDEEFPQVSELLIQRTMRQARAERSAGAQTEAGLADHDSDGGAVGSRAGRTGSDATGPEPPRPFMLMAAAAAAIIALGGAGFIGRATAPDPTPLAKSPARVVPTGTLSPSPQVRVASKTNYSTGARMVVQLRSAKGWVRVYAMVSGVPAGEKCRLFVVGRDGTSEIAASWLTAAEDKENGSKLNGAAAVAPDGVTAVEVRNNKGRTYVSVPFSKV